MLRVRVEVKSFCKCKTTHINDYRNTSHFPSKGSDDQPLPPGVNIVKIQENLGTLYNRFRAPKTQKCEERYRLNPSENQKRRT